MLFTWVCKGEDGQQHSAKTGTTSDVCKQDTVGPSSGLKDGVASESGLGLHTLIAKQQNEVLHLLIFSVYVPLLMNVQQCF